MSGPVRAEDAAPDETLAMPGARPLPPTVEITPSHDAVVGALHVRRALPRRARRTVGAWCFADHMGPTAVTEQRGVDIGPHPHIGLQTVTWLVSGEILHRDSLGSEQLIRPGQLNLMTAGHGVAHAEEATGRYRGDLHGMQLWIAQPEATRHGAAAFEHHAELPQVELDHATATVIIGAFGAVTSPARRDTDHVGVELDLRPGRCTIPLVATYEHALIVLDGAVSIDPDPTEAPRDLATSHHVAPGSLAYLGRSRDELVLTTTEPARLLLIGGEPAEAPPLMFWNFVARTHDEVAAAYEQWQAHDLDRFPSVASHLARIDSPRPPWLGGEPADRRPTSAPVDSPP